MKAIIIIIMLLTLTGDASFRKFCDAVVQKEQGPFEQDNKYEMSYAFFQCGRDHLYKLGYSKKIHYHELKNNDTLCRLIIKAYLYKYAKHDLINGNWYRLARIYNGGPTGNRKKVTKEYAQCIVNLMEAS